MFEFGNPNLFAQGVVEQTLYDPKTGDVLGYDRLGTDVALNYTFEFSEITGGFQNQLAGLIPHTTRMMGTYTSAAFSLESRQLLSGGKLQYNGIAPICETITATNATLTVSNTPVRAYAQDADDPYCWCQVREHGASTYLGTNYGVSPSTKQVQNFTATVGKQYDVFYFVVWASARELGLPVAADPSAVTVHQKWGIYASQNGNNKSGTLQGFLYVIVPLAILEGDAGMNGNQTSNTTSSYNWRAVTNNENMPSCNSCEKNDNNYGYYVYVPCGDKDSNIVGICAPGGSITVPPDPSANVQIPAKYIFKDGSVGQADYSAIEWSLEGAGQISINQTGVVSNGDSIPSTGLVTMTYTREDGTVLTGYCIVNPDRYTPSN